MRATMATAAKRVCSLRQQNPAARTLRMHVRHLQNWSADREEVRLRFKCVQCGKCCTGKGGRVRVNARELEALADATQTSKREFAEKYTREPAGQTIEGAGSLQRQWVLKQTADDRQCVFLDGVKCSVYQARPTQCRTFPWWPQNLISDYDWQLAAADCEGIRIATSDETQQALDDGGEAVAYSFDDVLPETILHDIHRSGENYTYDELETMLRDLRDVDPDFVASYKAEFFANFSRRVVFRDAQVTVLDSFFDGPFAPASRSFVFNDRMRLTQSEVALQPANGGGAANADTINLAFDRSTLALEVHRALCLPLAWLPQKDQPPLHVAVLGAGACVLPLFLLAHHKADRISRLDAVEPSAEVISVGRRFFGVKQADERLVVHQQTGENFLREQLATDATFDLVVLDVEAGESHEGVRAPTLSMLEPEFLQAVKRLLGSQHKAALALNVITDSEEALGRVDERLSQVFSRGLRLSLPSNTVFFLLNDEQEHGTAALEIAECVRLAQASTFQSENAKTPELLQTCSLVRWPLEPPDAKL